MNSRHIEEYITPFERVLSYGHKHEYISSLMERSISYSPFFQDIENDIFGLSPIISEEFLVNSIFGLSDAKTIGLPVYNQCLWAAEAYLRIQGKTYLTFECIFLYIPIKKMYQYFPLYHEMDFSQIVDEFVRLYKEKSVISILSKNYRYSTNDLCEKTGIPYSTLYSLKQRRRNILKLNFESVSKLARVFNVRMETISELKIKQ